MFDAVNLLTRLISDGARGSKRSKHGFDAVAAAPLILGAIGVVVGAYEHYTQSRPGPTPASAPPPPPSNPVMPPPPPQPAAFDPAQLAPRDADALHLLRAMIAAAQADGLMDRQERERILARCDESGIDAAARAFVLTELDIARAPDQIAAWTRNGLSQETYLASACAIQLDSEAERLYLARLATCLGIDETTRLSLHERVALRQA